MIELAKAGKQCNLDNGNEPAGPTLGEADIADAEVFLRNLLKILPLLGISAFQKKVESQERNLLYLNSKGIKGTGYVHSSGFIVRKGSSAVIQEVNSISQYLTVLRKDLLDKGILVCEGELYRFTTDYNLSSPSTAAGVLMGRSANGRIEWSDEAGRSLKRIQESEVR